MSEETLQARNGDWDKDFQNEEKKTESKKEYKKIPFMTFPKPGSYRIRLVGKYVSFLKHWKPLSDTVKYPIITHETYKEQDLAWKAGFYPGLRHAIHVIDRGDGEVKVLEQGKAIFSAFSEYKKVNQINPASATEGPDFVITVEWPEGNKNSAKYKVTPVVKASPLTPDEIEKIKTARIVLEDRYKTTPLSKINELWNSLPEDKKAKKTKEDGKSNKSSSSKKTEEIVEKIPEAPAETDDMFGDDSNDQSKDF